MKCRRCQIAQTQQGAAQTAITQVPVSDFLPSAPPLVALRDRCRCFTTRQGPETQMFVVINNYFFFPSVTVSEDDFSAQLVPLMLPPGGHQTFIFSESIDFFFSK